MYSKNKVMRSMTYLPRHHRRRRTPPLQTDIQVRRVTDASTNCKTLPATAHFVARAR